MGVYSNLKIHPNSLLEIVQKKIQQVFFLYIYKYMKQSFHFLNVKKMSSDNIERKFFPENVNLINLHKKHLSILDIYIRIHLMY